MAEMTYEDLRNEYPDGEVFKNQFELGKFLQEYYHGGGHEGAAGAQITEDEFIKILKAKHI